MIDYIEVSFIFNLWYPTVEFWIYYFSFSLTVLPITIFRIKQMINSRFWMISKSRIIQMVVASILLPAISIGAIHGICKNAK